MANIQIGTGCKVHIYAGKRWGIYDVGPMCAKEKEGEVDSFVLYHPGTDIVAYSRCLVFNMTHMGQTHLRCVHSLSSAEEVTNDSNMG